VTKKDIVRTISEEVGLTQQQTKEIVQKTFDAIIDSLVRERRIELRNFGVFEVKPRAARKARNPRTGQQVEVPRKHVVTFKPGKHMEAKVRNLDDAAAIADQTDAVKKAVNQAAGSRPSTSDEEYPSENRPDSQGVSRPMSGRWDTE
jgi:DNA-binding protein HU-beta/integration host factor subunit beta